jgi:hypothetical protein
VVAWGASEGDGGPYLGWHEAGGGLYRWPSVKGGSGGAGSTKGCPRRGGEGRRGELEVWESSSGRGGLL